MEIIKMNYYSEIKNIIEEREINKKVRELKDNREDLLTRWNIGKLLVAAQGGSERAQYGTNLIKNGEKSLKKNMDQNMEEQI